MTELQILKADSDKAKPTDYSTTPVRGDHVESVVKQLLEYFKEGFSSSYIQNYLHSEPHLNLMNKIHQTGNLTVAETLLVCERFEYITKEALAAEVRSLPGTNLPGIVFRLKSADGPKIA